MAPVTLPPSFYNSFWSSDYRSGLEALFRQLDKGTKEAEDLAEFIETQVEGHHALAKTLFQTPTSPSSSTTSLQHTLAALKAGSSARGEAHRALALELESRILIGFNQWRERHGERLAETRKDVLSKQGIVGRWEKEAKTLASLRSAYATKARAADDGEDDAKFAPGAMSASASTASVKSPTASVGGSLPPSDSYTASPKPKSAVLQRSGTVADRISEKLRAASISSSPLSPTGRKPVLSIDGKSLPAPPTPLSGTPGQQSPTSPSSPREEAFIPPSDPNGKPSFGPPVPNKDGPASLDVTHILLSGLSLPASGLKDLLNRFDAYLLSTPAPHSDAAVSSTRSNAALASRQRTTILGVYEKTFSGEEIAEWLKTRVEGFGGDWERSIDAARELLAMGHLSRVGVGRGFEAQDDIFYTLRTQPDASPISAKLGSQAAAALKEYQPHISPATSANIQNMLKTYVPARFAPSDEPPHVRLRREAGVAEDKYRDAVKVAEAHRLELEQRIERGLRVWEQWERERLAVFQQVLRQYDAALAKLPARLREVQKTTQLSIETYNPDADLRSLIEGHRTGPFRPQAHIFDSLESDLPEVNFGIDLRRWAGDSGWRAAARTPQREKGSIPDVLAGLLQGLHTLYGDVDDAEKRKAWIYEVPLAKLHAVRDAVNSPELSASDVSEIAKEFDGPATAGTIKLYLLELNPPVMGYEGWEDARGVYPAVGADQERDATSAVTSVLARLPGAQLYVLDALIGHLRKLIDSTKTEESEEVYITKLSLSLGRCILRPQVESDLTIGDRTPQLFFADLLNLYENIFPSLVEKKKQEAERVMPVRKRTALVDERPSRRNISEDDTPQTLFERQHHMRPSLSSSGDVPPVPRIPLEDKGAVKVGEQALTTEPGSAGPTREEKGKGKDTASDEPPTLASPVDTQLPTFAPPAPPVAGGPPSMPDPQDSDDEREPPFRPPTDDAAAAGPQSNAQGGAPVDDSATDDILESYADAEDQPVAGVAATGGASGLKRATSGDTTGGAATGGVGSASRLRGPRGARGPRAPGGRSIAGMTGVAGDEGEDGRSSPTPGATRPRPSHAPKGSVSAMAARFEQS